MRRRAPIGGVGAIGVALLLGCTPSSFERTDDTFHPHRRQKFPLVFLDAAPDYAYRSVGTFDVQDGSAEDVTRRARTDGRDIGCELVVAELLYRTSLGIPGAGPLLAQYQSSQYRPAPLYPTPGTLSQPLSTPLYRRRSNAPPPPSTPLWQSHGPPPRRVTFVCALVVRKEDPYSDK